MTLTRKTIRPGLRVRFHETFPPLQNHFKFSQSQDNGTQKVIQLRQVPALSGMCKRWIKHSRPLFNHVGKPGMNTVYRIKCPGLFIPTSHTQLSGVSEGLKGTVTQKKTLLSTTLYYTNTSSLNTHFVWKQLYSTKNNKYGMTWGENKCWHRYLINLTLDNLAT